MSRILRTIGAELLRVLPAALFFFMAFNLIVLTEDLAVEQYGLKLFRFTGAAVAALLIAKVLLIVDALPFADAFRNSPLIYVTLWKAGLYLLAALVFFYIEHLIPPLFRYRSLASAQRHMVSGIVWPRFWAVQIWLVVLVLVFAAFQELVRVVGGGQLRRMFFGR